MSLIGRQSRPLSSPAHSPIVSITASTIVLTITGMAFILSAGGCTQLDPVKDAVTVEKQSAAVEKKILSTDQSQERIKAMVKPNTPALADADAYTEWFYSCKADLESEDVMRDDTIGASSIAIKVKGVKFKLALPITVHLPENARADLKQHEDGHVQICSIVYGKAEEAAVAAAREVIGRTFNGMGKDPAGARHMAMAQAQHIIAQRYHEGTALLADQASQRYEILCLQYAADPNFSRKTLAREACKRVIDVPAQPIK